MFMKAHPPADFSRVIPLILNGVLQITATALFFPAFRRFTAI